MALAIGLLVYVLVALANYSIVQSLVGSYVSSFFSKEWGGKVKIGSLGCNPFNHLVLRDVELINPANDTICTAHTIAIRFDKFPFDSKGLTMKRLYLKDTYYHLNIDSAGLNLKFIIDYYKPEHPSPPREEPVEFKVLCDELVMDNVCYRQDLKESATYHRDSVGVDIPHMEYANIHARFRNVRVDKDHVTCRIDRFTTRERSGLEVRSMQMNVYVSPTGISATDMVLETADSHLEGDVLLDYTSWKSMSHFLDSVYFTCHFNENTYGGMQDAAYWAHTLWGMDQQVWMCGDVSGPVQDLHVDNYKIAMGNDTRLELDGYIYGLPNIDTTVISVEVRNLHTTYADLAAVKHPRGISMKAPDLMRKLEYVDMDASFSGTIRDFYATFDIQSRLGDLKGDVVLAFEPGKNNVKYVGEVSSSGFWIGAVAPNEWVARSGFELSFEGHGLDPQTMNASLEGNLNHMVVRGQRLMNEATVSVDATDGTATAELALDDPLASLAARASVRWTEAGKSYEADIDAQHLDLKRLGLWNAVSDTSAFVDAHLHGRYADINENRNFARITLDGLHLNTTTKNYRLHNATVIAREQNGWRNLSLNSDIMTAQMRGYFTYDALGGMVRDFMRSYLPENLVASPARIDDRQMASVAAAQMDLDVEWHDSSHVLEVFVPSLALAQGTRIQANYNHTESFKPLVRSDSVRIGSVTFHNVGVNGETAGDRYRLRLTSDEVMMGGLKISENGDVFVESNVDEAQCRIRWENQGQAVGGGDINVRLVTDSNRNRVIIDNSHLALGGRDWKLTDDGGRFFFGDHLFLVDGLRLVSDSQMLSVHAVKQNRSDDEVTVELSNFGLGIVNTWLGTKGMSLDGTAVGSVNIGGLSDVPYLNADLSVADLRFDGERLGDARVRSTWNAEMDQLNLYLLTNRLNPSEAGATISQPLQVVGYVGLGDEDPEVNFTVSAEDVDLQAIQPFVSSFSSMVEGHASAEIDVSGTLKTPVVTGYAVLDKGALLVDFLNVTYRVSDTVMLDTGRVTLHDVVVVDDWGNTARANGTVNYEKLDNMRFDIDVRSDKFLCMNTTARHSNTYYGTIVASLDGRVRGVSNDLDIVIDAQTLPGSQLIIPISDDKQVKTADYIRFASPWDDVSLNEAASFGGTSIATGGVQPGNNTIADTRVAPSGSAYHLTINVDATPDLQMYLPLTMSVLDADIKTTGAGALQLRVGSDAPFSILGDYEMNRGTLMLNVLGLTSADFSIDEGSSITFPGAISSALFDIKAVHSQRVNLSSLTGSLSSESQKQINVENVIAINGTLQNPNLDFDLRLPNADQSVEEEVFAYIDRSNERDMLNQTVSLLLFKRFYSTSGQVDQGQTSVASEGYSFVANNLGSVVSSMVQVVDVNFEYKAGNALTTDQYAVDISKEWNKFYFETTLGFGGEAREMSDVNGNNNMTGDMLVGYKINPRLHLFVFNRSNTNDYTRSDLPYKQGVGVKYTRDFDNFRDLFSPKKKEKQ